MTRKPELAVKSHAALGEGPFWDRDNRLLYWVDILQMKLHIHDPAAGKNQEVSVGHFIGSAAVRNSHELVVALQDGFFFFDIRSEKLTPITNPEAHIPTNRFNDGKCDPRGRFWAGTQPLEGKAGAVDVRGASALYCLDLDHTAKKVIDGVSISNGIAWSPDKTIMYYIDSKVMAIAAFDYDLETGEIKNRRYPIEISGDHGIPDGMTIDDEGMLYVAEWDGYQVSKWDPMQGKCVDSIKFPIAKVTSCAFGGPNLDELYVTTAHLGVKPGDDAQCDAGSVFRIKMNVTGAECYKYCG
jgi:sugar lactone lactonase YvrE